MEQSKMLSRVEVGEMGIKGHIEFRAAGVDPWQ